MEAITKMFEKLDFSTLLPKMDTLMGKMEFFLRLAVLLGPAVLCLLGLCYLILPAKEANHRYGYRFYWGMSSIDVWRFTQRLGGAVLAVVGLGLTLFMAVYTVRLRNMEVMDMVWAAVRCALWEMGIVLVAHLGVDITVIACYNGKGERRRKKQDAETEEEPAEYGDTEEDVYEDEGEE